MNAAIIALIFAQVTPPVVALPTSPIGKWTLDYGEASCVLSHEFGTADNPISLAFSPSPLGVDTDVAVITSGTRNGRYPKGIKRLVLQPSGQQIDGELITVPPSVKGQSKTILSFTVEGKTALGLKLSSQIVIRFSDGSEQTFVTPERDKAFDALNNCQSNLFKAWGYDPHERDQMMTPPKRVGMADWFTDDDYPADALSKGEHGTTLALYLVGASGTISDCRIISSSGSASLDQATCSALSKRARYVPATGLNGRTMAVHQVHRAVWRLPD